MPGGRPPKRTGATHGNKSYKELYEKEKETTSVHMDEPSKVPVEIPEPDPKWDPIARMWWDALPLSGQSVFYEASDWAQAYYITVLIDQTCRERPFTDGAGQVIYDPETGRPYMTRKLTQSILQTIFSASSELLVTEGARRKVKMEIRRPEQKDTNGGDADIVDLSVVG